MSSKPLISPCRNLYEEDFVAWTEQTARLLRSGRLAELDVDNLTEEVEDMGKSRRQELHSRLTVLIWHLLKWRHQPEKRSVSWDLTIDKPGTYEVNCWFTIPQSHKDQGMVGVLEVLPSGSAVMMRL
jgi:hypothetical protein